MRLLLLLLFICSSLTARVTPGIDRLVTSDYKQLIAGKRIALFTTQAAVTAQLKPSATLLKEYEPIHGYKLVALFAPEHGLDGAKHAGEKVDHSTFMGIPVYSLHGSHRRPSKEQLQGIDVLVIDIQDLGSRSYTFLTTASYLIEEAAKQKIAVVITDRPNPINGLVVDGPRLQPQWQSFLGYLNIPYCHGMTLGELMTLYNEEAKLGCKVSVVPMQGWNRSMTFAETGLNWIPTSPNIPEATSPLYYPITGILGELQIVSIGIGYTLPFRVVGAPWIDADTLASKLNAQKLTGIHFQPIHFKPFHGKFAKEECHGVLLVVTDPKTLKPVTTGYTLIGMLKSMYPQEFSQALKLSGERKNTFNRVNGNELVYKALESEPYPAWTLRELAQKEASAFEKVRQRFLIREY
ncbi:MAG: DUF1343 domain-containing protein, partial [Chlamydiia bacterium]|nr:DUF1343 domain-containing protein [Chlamydiia bacterium]